MSVYVLIGLGLALLVIGGEVLVRGASSAARKLGVSPLVIGLTLVGFGTSTPELVTSLQAALAGSPGIALGSVVGSNISNALLILGLTALIAPIAVDRRAFLRDGPMLALVTAASGEVPPGRAKSHNTQFRNRSGGFPGCNVPEPFVIPKRP